MKCLKTAFLSLLLLPAGWAGADSRLTYEVRPQLRYAPVSQHKMKSLDAWSGAAGAKLEYADSAWLFQAAENRLVFVEHGTKTYQVFPIPFAILDYQPEATKEDVRRFFLSLAPQTRLEGPGAAEVVGDYHARRWAATTTTAGQGTFELETWLSSELGDRCAMLERLQQARSALNPVFGAAERQILDLPGCMVRQIVRKSGNEAASFGTETRLVAIREVPAEPERFAPPAGYREVPVDQKIVGGFVEGQPLPSR